MLTQENNNAPKLVSQINPSSLNLQRERMANMCHDIRLPVSAILGLSQILSDTMCSSQKKKECVAMLRDTSSMLAELLNEFIDLTRPDARKYELAQVPFDLEKIAQEALRIVSIKSRQKNIELYFKYSPSLSSTFVGDPARIRQILVNLLDNAIKFTNKGSVGLIVEGKELEGSRTRLNIEVCDTGIGIKKELLETIFDRYVQVHENLDVSMEGSGLGLSICQSLVTRMNGLISVDTTLRVGSTFRVMLDLALSDTLRDAA